MAYVDFLTKIHTSTKRDYVARVTEHPKGECAQVAKQFAFDYWDGDRKYGYGGYKYDGRWQPIAAQIIAHYDLKAGDKVLDVGCGKAFLAFEMSKALPGLEVRGIDISEYGIQHAPEGIRPSLQVASATDIPFEDDSFDLVLSINAIHNLRVYDLDKAIREIQRVGRKHKYIVAESYRNESEKANLLYWQLTCEAFNTPEEWQWWFDNCGYDGDHSFIYFE